LRARRRDGTRNPDTLLALRDRRAERIVCALARTGTRSCMSFNKNLLDRQGGVMLKLKTLAAALVVSLFAMVSLSVSAQLAEKKALTLDAAKKIAAAAEAEAKKNSWNVVI